MKKTTSSFREAKVKGNKLTMLTAYDYTTAKLLDEAGIDGILIGDSLGMVMLGYENTLQVTVEDVLHHTKAVARGTKEALVVADMPFLSYHISVEDAIKNCGRMIQEGCASAVKLEGGEEIINQIKGIVNAKIPVMGHLGLTPQSVNIFGGFKIQGKTKESVEKLVKDAKLLEEAGVFAIVLECVPEEVAEIVTRNISIPTIGIGAGNKCDGQILVVQDLLGLYSDLTPKFVKQYKRLGEEVNEGVKAYIYDVKQGLFPEDIHSFHMDKSEADELKKLY